MRSVIVIAGATLLASLAAGATPPAANDGIACFADLPTPEYPAAAIQARVDGSVWTWTQVNAQGVPGKIDTQVVSAWSDGSKLLVPAVEKAIHAAKFKPECNGKTVRVVVRYQYGGPLPPDAKAREVDGDYLMTIKSEPQPVKQISRRR